MTNNHCSVSSVACQLVRSFSQWSYCFGSKHCIAALPPGTSWTLEALDHTRAWRTMKGLCPWPSESSWALSTAISVKDCPFLCPVVRMGWPKPSLHMYTYVYIPAGIACVLRSHTQMCYLFVRSCSHMNCLMRKVPSVNGCNAASAAVFKLICLSQTMPRYLKESV